MCAYLPPQVHTEGLKTCVQENAEQGCSRSLTASVVLVNAQSTCEIHGSQTLAS